MGIIASAETAQEQRERVEAKVNDAIYAALIHELTGGRAKLKLETDEVISLARTLRYDITSKVMLALQYLDIVATEEECLRNGDETGGVDGSVGN